ncbi:hypothetical protein DXG01_015633 [Tephrocybe rancida]|nr:hypothetical protein DXG01_015633 [Tephrocybe rancida]
MASTRSVYSGLKRKLVLALDIGTTFSGVSYSILDPGQVPEIRSVSRYPEQTVSDAKIPTIIYYDRTGLVCAVGAEAIQEGLHEQVEDGGWTKVEWFKLHMRPLSMVNDASLPLPPLPAGKTLIDIFADLMHYLYSCARSYITNAHPSGGDLWASGEDKIEFVLAHPNGWEGAQQGQMREAAILAGLIPDTREGHSRVHFVTEGEASLHFCVQAGLTTDALEVGICNAYYSASFDRWLPQRGEGILVVDAGGGTVDLSAYGQQPASKGHAFEEVSAPEYHLRGSKFMEDLDTITEHFDKNSKATFRNTDEPRFIKFGGARDRDLKLGIRGGQLKLEGPDVARFFEPSVACIIQAIMRQRESAQRPISVGAPCSFLYGSVFLVGGFAASEWLLSQLKLALGPFGLDICRPDTGVNKAVAEGAVSFYLDHFVSVRVAKFYYGVECTVLYDEHNREHRARSSRIYTSLAGFQRLPGYFDAILHKVWTLQLCVVRGNLTERLTRISPCPRPKNSDVHMPSVPATEEPFDASKKPCNVTEELQKYLSGWMQTDVRFMVMFVADTHEPIEMYSTLCTIEADTSKLSETLQLVHAEGKASTAYFRMEYDIVLSFGLTELKAQIAWVENDASEDSVRHRKVAVLPHGEDEARIGSCGIYTPVTLNKYSV